MKVALRYRDLSSWTPAFAGEVRLWTAYAPDASGVMGAFW